MQIKRSKNVLLFVTGLFLFLSLIANSFASTSRSLTIFAEPNMVWALAKISRLYSRKFNVVITVNFNSHDLIGIIDSGEPANIFISVHQFLIEALHQKGLVDFYNNGYIASDKLVLVTSKNNPDLLKEFRDKKQFSFEEALAILDRSKSTLILDYSGKSSGEFSNNFIKNSPFFNLNLLHKLPEDKSSILTTIRNNPASYAILLASQLKNRTDFQILATKNDQNIFYQALIIASDNMEIAREFLKFLGSSEAKQILKQSGFNVS
jgi:molybdenum ABC transporter molybdate-binding protein